MKLSVEQIKKSIATVAARLEFCASYARLALVSLNECDELLAYKAETIDTELRHELLLKYAIKVDNCMSNGHDLIRDVIFMMKNVVNP